MGESNNVKEMSNSDLKIYLKTLENSFEGKKMELRAICEKMDEIEKEYMAAKHELEIRRNILN